MIVDLAPLLVRTTKFSGFSQPLDFFLLDYIYHTWSKEAVGEMLHSVIAEILAHSISSTSDKEENRRRAQLGLDPLASTDGIFTRELVECMVEVGLVVAPQDRLRQHAGKFTRRPVEEDVVAIRMVWADIKDGGGRWRVQQPAQAVP